MGGGRTAALALLSVLGLLWAGGAHGEMIHLFARKGDVDKVMGEIAKGVPVDLPSTRNTTETGVSPLFIAAKFGHARLVQALIDAGADVQTFFDPHDGSDPYGTALHAAAAWGQSDVVRVLIDAGAEIDPYHRRIGTPLHRALEAGKEGAAQLLLDAGAVTRIETPLVSDAIAAADLALGEEIGTGCGGCHPMKKDEADPPEIGPELWDIVGRKKAAVEGFAYSSVMLRDTGAWTYEALNSYLAAPYKYLPGTKMHFSGIEDARRRAALIAFLRTLSDTPVPLP